MVPPPQKQEVIMYNIVWPSVPPPEEAGSYDPRGQGLRCERCHYFSQHALMFSWAKNGNFQMMQQRTHSHTLVCEKLGILDDRWPLPAFVPSVCLSWLLSGIVHSSPGIAWTPINALQLIIYCPWFTKIRREREREREIETEMFPRHGLYYTNIINSETDAKWSNREARNNAWNEIKRAGRW